MKLQNVYDLAGTLYCSNSRALRKRALERKNTLVYYKKEFEARRPSRTKMSTYTTKKIPNTERSKVSEVSSFTGKQA